MKEEHVDDNLRELGEVVDHLEALLNVLADLLDEEVVESLLKPGQQSVGSGSKCTRLPKNVVDIAMMLGKAFRELVVLLRERADIDAAEGVGLGERERQRKAGPV